MADPLNEVVIQAILFLGFDDNGDVERYAKDYYFYDDYLKQLQTALKNKYSTEIYELKENEHNHTNEAFCKKINLCAYLIDAGLDMSEYVMTAVKGRSWRTISDEEIYELTDVLCDYGDHLGQDLVEWSVTRLLNAKKEQDENQPGVA